MKLLRKENIRAWRLISTPLTNIGRLRDSKPESPDNKRNIASFIAYGGWSDDYPAVVGEYNNWFFTASAVQGGCTAEQYIKDENTKRTISDALIHAYEGKDASIKIRAFEDLYYENDKLAVLTEENGLWVHSGHQRIQMVILPAYEGYLHTIGDLPAGMTKDDVPPTPAFKLDVPCNVKQFESLEEILKDQMSMNMGADIHNALDVLDLTKSAKQMIGNKAVPKYGEREFRRFCAEPGTMTEKGGNDGGYPRLAYLLAIINYYYRGALGFYDSLVTQEIQKHPEITEGVKNPEWINFKLFSATGTDPRYNVSVIARLMEPGLGKLTDYANRFGPGSKFVADGGASKLCEMENVVLKRGYCWTEEEAMAWVNSVKPHKLGYGKPVEKTKPEPFTVEPFKNVINSANPSLYVRSLLGEMCKLSVPVPGPVQPVPVGILDRASEVDRDALDTLFVLSTEDEHDKLFRGVIVELGHLRDGNRAAFNVLIESIGKQISSVPSAVKVEGTIETANGDLAIDKATLPVEESKGKKKASAK